jgi:hypothetical protein
LFDKLHLASGVGDAIYDLPWIKGWLSIWRRYLMSTAKMRCKTYAEFMLKHKDELPPLVENGAQVFKDNVLQHVTPCFPPGTSSIRWLAKGDAVAHHTERCEVELEFLLHVATIQKEKTKEKEPKACTYHLVVSCLGLLNHSSLQTQGKGKKGVVPAVAVEVEVGDEEDAEFRQGTEKLMNDILNKVEGNRTLCRTLLVGYNMLGEPLTSFLLKFQASTVPLFPYLYQAGNALLAHFKVYVDALEASGKAGGFDNLPVKLRDLLFDLEKEDRSDYSLAKSTLKVYHLFIRFFFVFFGAKHFFVFKYFS